MISLSQKPIRVLVVDDSAFMRKAISTMFSDTSGCEVVGTARNGEDALEKVAKLMPDVMTLDIDMPGMNGLTVLERVMTSNPLPIVVVSALTEAGAEVTVQALALGAVDFIPKQTGNSPLKISAIREALIEKVRIAAQAKGKIHPPLEVSPDINGTYAPEISASSPGLSLGNPPSISRNALMVKKSPPVASRHSGIGLPPLLVIGSSTGGPQALQEVLSGLSASLPAGVVVAQHMPKMFTKPFAERMNRVCPLRVVEAKEGDLIQKGVVLIAPGGKHMTVERLGAGPAMCHISDEPAGLPYRPSVDRLMQSAAKVFGAKILGIVLTGMGNDGLEGARAIQAVHGRVLAQDEASCIVYGMPKAVIEGGCVDKTVSLSRVAYEVNYHFLGRDTPVGVKSQNTVGRT